MRSIPKISIEQLVQEKIHFISVFPDIRISAELDRLVHAVNPVFEHTAISGKHATELLITGRMLLEYLESYPGFIGPETEIEERNTFSRCANSCLATLGDNERYVVIAPDVVAFDLVYLDGINWGDRYIFSYLPSDQMPSAELLLRASSPHTSTLQAYLMVCPMAMDRNIPRHLQDIVIAASALESQLPVEIWLQPTFKKALDAFHRNDVSLLHVDTHGTSSSIMLGPTRGDQEYAY